MSIIGEFQGTTGWITLNRPQALNALSLPMIREFEHYLTLWENLPSLSAVITQGAGEKAFCAGGDIRFVYEAKRRENLHECEAFFREEYALNTHIHQYPKPHVALIDGIAMGGGLGISVNGSHRIVTEKALLAMPETGIGLFPDAGGTSFLRAIPGIMGLYLGLTGTRLKAADALWTGLATHFMPSADLSLFKTALLKGMPLEEALALYCQSHPEEGFLEHHQAVIEAHFNKPSLREIFQSLSQDSSPFAQNTYNVLRSKSPTSLAVTFRQLTTPYPPLSFAQNMQQEFHLTQHFIRGHDLMEGIRAVIIDKDSLPRWKPSALEELQDQEIDRYFTPLDEV
jgi:enoyl-CoA hydratase